MHNIKMYCLESRRKEEFYESGEMGKSSTIIDLWGDPSKLDFYETTSVVSFFFMQLEDRAYIEQDSSILAFLLFAFHCSIL